MVSLSALFLRWCSQLRDFGLQHLCVMRSLQVLSVAGKITLIITLCHLSYVIKYYKLYMTNNIKFIIYIHIIRRKSTESLLELFILENLYIEMLTQIFKMIKKKVYYFSK